ncbi:hypothetical protein [Pseudomonas sp. H9]|uniref:hypothetical protein n=1 Tax=Pseudomonas sp. H9 TaxID=483968 RepID=UPI001057A4A7|nr:hypothetical protein [Pseudomonas sp. H9]TDF82397.1 hypothetical protein E1573_14625 [Pseudomonas sp. H9]
MQTLRRHTLAPLSLMLAAFSVPAVADFSFGRSDEAMLGLGKAYGYLLAQDYTLKLIPTRYPELQASAKSAELNFASVFGNSIKDKLGAEISAAIGEDTFRPMVSRMEAALAEKIDVPALTHRNAVKFIAEVNNAEKGKVDASVFPYLAAVRYKDQPASEFTDKLLQRFDTQGQPNSLGVNLMMDLPISWVAEKAHTKSVQRWHSMAGYGRQVITLDVVNTGARISTQDIKDQLAGGRIRTLTPPDSTFINGGAQTVASLPGYWLDYNTEVEQDGFKAYQAVRLNVFFKADKAVLVSCGTTSSQAKKAQADKDFTKLQALCPLVVNSIVLH